METTETKSSTTVQTAPTVTTTTMRAEERYSAEEFMQAAPKLFGKRCSPYLVLAAFRANKKDSATIAEAQRMVDAFATKEVK